MTAPVSRILSQLDGAALEQLEKSIERALRDLPDAELSILRLRFGIGTRRRSQRDVARRLRLSVGTVRRVERRALRDLRALSLPNDVPRCRTVPRGALPLRRSIGPAVSDAAHAVDEPAQLVGC